MCVSFVNGLVEIVVFNQGISQMAHSYRGGKG